MEMSERRNWWVVTATGIVPSSNEIPILGHDGGRHTGTTIETFCNCKFHDIQGRLILLLSRKIASLLVCVRRPVQST